MTMQSNIHDSPTSTGSDYWAKDYTGSYPFDYIADHGEWMDSGFFPEDVRARLKGGQVKARRYVTVTVYLCS